MGGFDSFMSFPDKFVPSFLDIPSPSVVLCCSFQGLAGHSTGALCKGAWCPSSPSLKAEARAQE